MRSSGFLASGIRQRRLLVACIAIICLVNGAAGADDPLAAQRAEFLQAYGQTAGTRAVVPEDSTSLKRYLLFSYLQAARLGQALREAGTEVPAALDQQVANFLR